MVDGWNWCCSTAQTGLGNCGGETQVSKDIFDMQLTAKLVPQLLNYEQMYLCLETGNLLYCL